VEEHWGWLVGRQRRAGQPAAAEPESDRPGFSARRQTLTWPLQHRPRACTPAPPRPVAMSHARLGSGIQSQSSKSLPHQLHSTHTDPVQLKPPQHKTNPAQPNPTQRSPTHSPTQLPWPQNNPAQTQTHLPSGGDGRHRPVVDRRHVRLRQPGQHGACEHKGPQALGLRLAEDELAVWGWGGWVRGLGVCVWRGGRGGMWGVCGDGVAGGWRWGLGWVEMGVERGLACPTV